MPVYYLLVASVLNNATNVITFVLQTRVQRRNLIFPEHLVGIWGGEGLPSLAWIQYAVSVQFIQGLWMLEWAPHV